MPLFLFLCMFTWNVTHLSHSPPNRQNRSIWKDRNSNNIYQQRMWYVFFIYRLIFNFSLSFFLFIYCIVASSEIKWTQTMNNYFQKYILYRCYCASKLLFYFIDESVLMDLKALLVEAKQKVPPVLQVLQTGDETMLDIGGTNYILIAETSL